MRELLRNSNCVAGMCRVSTRIVNFAGIDCLL